MPRNRILLALAVLLFGLAACQTDSSNSGQSNESSEQNSTALQSSDQSPELGKAVDPPFEKLRIPLKKHRVNCSQEQRLYLETGTEIIIPANAFVDAQGKAVQGEVSLAFREFHDATDLIISGIVMQEAKTGRSMETAGMFEIRGEQNGQEIFIAPDKSLEVRLASFTEGDHFHDFQLNEETGEWKLLSENIPLVENKTRKAKLRQLDEALPEEPIRPKTRNNKAFVFDLDLDYRKYPELQSFEGVIWEYAGNGKNDPKKNPEVFQKDWDDVQLKPSNKRGKYMLVISNDTESFSTLVQPVLTGKNYKRALAKFEQSFEKYERAKVAQKAERQRLANEAAFQRTLQVNEFGFRNCDIWSEPGRTKCLANFVVPKSSGYVASVNKATFFLIEGSNRRVIRYYGNDTHKFSFDSNTPSAVVAVLPNDQVAVFPQERFKDLPIEQFSETKEEAFDFELQQAKISSPDDLRVIIEQAL